MTPRKLIYAGLALSLVMFVADVGLRIANYNRIANDGSASGPVWWPGRPRHQVLGRSVAGNRLEVEILSRPYKLDRVYRSMQGPYGNQAAIRLADDATVWLTGVETQVVDEDGIEPVSNEFFCHSNLTLSPSTTSPAEHNAGFARPTHADWRLFTLVPGRMSIELPEGFGVPIKNGTRVDYLTMSLNLNPDAPHRTVRMRTRVTVQLPGAPLRPLFRRALYVYQQHAPSMDVTSGLLASMETAATEYPSLKSDGHPGELCAENCSTSQLARSPSWLAELGAGQTGVHPGLTCCVENASEAGILRQFGPDHTIHWMVPPGRHVYRSEVTEQMQLPFATTAHYVTGHLHPFGTSLRLVDMASGAVVAEVHGRSFADRLGVAEMSQIKSQDGIALDPERRYELIAEYDNPLEEPIDAMAILYVYALDEPQ